MVISQFVSIVGLLCLLYYLCSKSSIAWATVATNCSINVDQNALEAQLPIQLLLAIVRRVSFQYKMSCGVSVVIRTLKKENYP